MKEYYVYILMNKTRRTLYIGVTNDLGRRLEEHNNEYVDNFTKRYKVHTLVYYEIYNDAYTAICREKQLKGWTRQKKEKLISTLNPEFLDLKDQLL